MLDEHAQCRDEQSVTKAKSQTTSKRGHFIRVCNRLKVLQHETPNPADYDMQNMKKNQHADVPDDKWGNGIKHVKLQQSEGLHRGHHPKLPFSPEGWISVPCASLVIVGRLQDPPGGWQPGVVADGSSLNRGKNASKSSPSLSLLNQERRVPIGSSRRSGTGVLLLNHRSPGADYIPNTSSTEPYQESCLCRAQMLPC